MKITALHDDRRRGGPSAGWMRLLGLELAAPRYYAYPVRDRFVEAFDAASYRRWLRRRPLAGASALSLYAHLPFCAAGCHHCTSDRLVTRSRARPRDYLRELAREITMVADEIGHGQQVARMHWGGGTPNYFLADELAGLADTIQGLFQLRPGSDRSIEIDPRSAEAGDRKST